MMVMLVTVVEAALALPHDSGARGESDTRCVHRSNRPGRPRPVKGPFSLFAACLPGLEPLLVAELTELGVSDARAEAGGVTFTGDARTLYRANLELGLASHVLVRVARVRAKHFAELVRKVSQVPWEMWLAAGAPIAVKVTARRSKLMHTGAIEERIRLGIAERLGQTPPDASEEDASTLSLHARMLNDVCQLSLDTSGVPLHRRGYRLATGKAPLREDLARALLYAARWDPDTSLLDPMMGSGTIVIEAALRARRLPPGRLRGFAFEHLVGFDAALWDEVQRSAMARARERVVAPIFGSDRNEGAVKAARDNAARAGVAEDLQLACAPLSSAPWERAALGPRGALLTNPPHGRRIGDPQQLKALHQRLGQLAQALPEGWSTALITSDRRLAFASGLALRTFALVDQGGTKVRLLTTQGAEPAQAPDA